tara:strand:- start:193 stop:813 length:621 start_codon:yes stop_codon:yes gene_type:complete
MHRTLPNVGIIEDKLNEKTINKLKSCIKDKQNKMNKKLAGNISESFSIPDKKNWFFKTVLLPLINQYSPKNLTAVVPNVLTENCSFVLHEFWVNFQKKFEFNPAHKHRGAFSFVIWVDIPSSYIKEKELHFTKHSNTPMANTFEFCYTNILGQIATYSYLLESEDEGTILLFPSSLVHLVYPFYLSNKNRVSISGNILLDPKKVIK